MPSHVSVVEVTDEEGFGGESVRLNVDVRTGDFVDEGRLADVGVSADEQRAGGRVDVGKTGDVLADLKEGDQTLLLLRQPGKVTLSSEGMSIVS